MPDIGTAEGPTATNVSVTKSLLNQNHKFVRMTVVGLSEKNCELALKPGDMGLSRLVDVNPRPIKTHYGVVWDGDTVAPKLLFDGWSGDSVEVVIEVWGI